MLEEANKMYNLFYESFYKKDVEKAHEIGVMKNQLLISKLYKLFQNKTGAEAVILYHIAEIIRLTHLASNNIFGLIEEQN